MKRPWMKFYPSDWRADPCVRTCSLAARGLWMEMLCLMHEAAPRGHLIVGKSAPTLHQLASISGSSLKEVRRLLGELEGAGVFSREGEIVISRRMLKEEVQAARDRQNGLKGGNPDLLGVNPKDKAHKLEARDQSLDKKEQEPQNQNLPHCRAVAKATRPMGSEKFEDFWMVYPKRLGANPKTPALKVFRGLTKSGVDPGAIIEGARRCAIADARKIGTEYIPQAVKWLRDRRWEDYPETVPASAEPIWKRPPPGARTHEEIIASNGGNHGAVGTEVRSHPGTGQDRPH